MRDVFPDKWLLCLCFNHDCKVRRVIRVGVSSGTVWRTSLQRRTFRDRHPFAPGIEMEAGRKFRANCLPGELRECLASPGRGRSNRRGPEHEIADWFVDVSWFSRTRSEGVNRLSARRPFSGAVPAAEKGCRGMSIPDRHGSRLAAATGWVGKSVAWWFRRLLCCRD